MNVHIFRLVGSNGQAVTVAERRLPLQGAFNFVIWVDMKRQMDVKRNGANYTVLKN